MRTLDEIIHISNRAYAGDDQAREQMDEMNADSRYDDLMLAAWVILGEGT
jgi:hypothetical protein